MENGEWRRARAMSEEFISVREASERFGYSGAHIRQLLASHKVEGRKFANIWMVEVASLERYRAAMERLGKRKHGLRASRSATDEAASREGRG